MEILRLFINPPIAIARLGGSTSPQSAYRWTEAPNPHSTADTSIEPDWSLDVQTDGSVVPTMPPSLQFRDGDLIRPVCPFLELWASLGEPGSKPKTWVDVPVTPELLRKQRLSLKDLAITVDAQNFKVSRRTGNPDLRFGTFPPLKVAADDFAPKPILAVSPSGVAAARKMIPVGQSIPLGVFQVIRSRKQPDPDPNHPWTQTVNESPIVNVEVIRFRFTPARGHFYGPPSAAKPHTPDDGGSFAPVDDVRAFLNGKAGWKGADAQSSAPDAPADTYDGADISQTGRNPSLGVVDDTCEARIQVSLSIGKSKPPLTAAASIFVSPPDFAPDRRPFLSLADELNDRTGDWAARNAQMTPAERDAWIQDLFQRVFETVSLLNLDQQRQGKAVNLKGPQLAPKPIAGDHTILPAKAMGGQDALRNPDFPLQPISNNSPLPLTEHARDRHRAISTLEGLRDFLTRYPGRLQKLVRAPFESEPGESPTGGGEIGTTTMRMPPFMRNSNAGPLTLATWQYDLLMAWVKEQSIRPKAAKKKKAKKALTKLSDGAARRRADVLARLARIREKSAAGDPS